MIAASVAADGGEASYYEAPSSSSQGNRSQSPVRFGLPDEGVSFDSFVASTPESSENR